MSKSRISSLESQVETLAQSESRLREQVAALEDEKKQLASTVMHLQELLSNLSLNPTLDGQTLTLPSERHTVTVPAKVEELITVTQDTLLHPLTPPESS